MGSFARLAKRALDTETPVMVQIQELFRGTTDAASLAQGVVHWQPPEKALDKVKEMVRDPSVSRYGTDEGLPELRNALMEKLHQDNKLYKSSVMVTAGANQAFVNIVLALCDVGDHVVMFAPYYFNAYMSFQMTGVTDIVVGPSNPTTLQPDADWLKDALSKKPVPKLVTVVNPGNPSGTHIPESLLKGLGLSSTTHMSECLDYLIIVIPVGLIEISRQDMYFQFQYFLYDGLKHSCIEGDHILNIFSFSKAYGMMGWRIGYIAYPTEVEGLAEQLLKIQDNIPICAPIISQRLALYSLETGTEWVRDQVKDLVKNRALLLDALTPLGQDAVKGGEGALYLWAKLPDDHQDDFKVVRWLAKRHRIVVIPGSASGGPGYVRISFGGLKESDCEVAAGRLRKGLEELVHDGMVE
ncbi:hypothetical protein Sjap_019091 [Stephania japonica]|uniref:Aminotransferase class I/classII large domain-containing protein n=1 Tax=Stephania japonica TaxID=461633 RepID=A0AAP0F3L9_9MAGN